MDRALGIMFEHGAEGEEIFKGWQRRWSDQDTDDAVRVAIITGISTQNPARYVVTIGPNLSKTTGSSGKVFTIVSRINRMEPKSSENLDRFLAAYRKFNCYFLVAAQSGPTPTFLRYALIKRHIHLRQAWEISENDPDSIALHEDDDPIIPPSVVDAPVKKVLARIKGFRGRLDPTS